MKKRLGYLGFVPALTLTSMAQVITWNIEKRAAGESLQRRSKSTFEETILNEKGRGGYFATVQIGSPGQNMTMQLDTGSSDVWIPHCDASVCKSGLCTLGSFNSSSSKTFYEIGEDEFSVSYVDDKYATGDYFKDRFQIGGTDVQNLTMGLGLKTDITYGLVGVGYATNEANKDSPYANLPVAMEENGLINSIAYSLWLNDLDANTGNILFGGVDTGKFDGPLTKIDVLVDEDADKYTEFIVLMSSLKATSPSGTDILATSESAIEVLLDSGSTLSYLPTELAQAVWKEVGAKYQVSLGMAILPCSHSAHPGYFSFGFAGDGGPTINVTMDELVIDLTNGDPPLLTSGPYAGEYLCAFGIQNCTSGTYVLGDTFLRSAYVVYDLENNQIGLAATRFNSTETNIVPFPSKGASIPGATAAPATTTTSPIDSVVDFPMAETTNLKAADGFQDGDSLEESSVLGKAHMLPNLHPLSIPLASALLFSVGLL
ncbi:unnamed protein product [Clonostachys rosea]|uniref:Peptidase A1 domain-containing protein n=1 Tax=Bionectria ochroleuca TaxID=29856 RepID=A0ABY6UFP6_BIOOC|nr:unnamed protein product [Clonostachys rosea]